MKRKLMLKMAVILMIFSGSQLYLNSQTCSCAATPLFNPLEYSTLKNRKWHFAIAYKYHAINDLVEGSKKIEDDTKRRRNSQALLLDIRYALFRSFTLRAVFSSARHEREVGISTALPVSTQGLGDGMLAIQYTPVYYSDRNRTEVSIGGGVKIPLGQSEAKIIGIASEDMQPGTGSWDGIAWVYVTRLVPLLSGLEIFTGIAARFNGSNNRSYRFGNEIIYSFGAKLHTKKIMNFSLYGRYRWANSDQRFKGDVPNTGGQWIYLVPAVTVRITRDIGFKTEGEIPVYRKLKGYRQFSSTFLISISFFYEI
jgi:hypothetical protein